MHLFLTAAAHCTTVEDVTILASTYLSQPLSYPSYMQLWYGSTQTHIKAVHKLSPTTGQMRPSFQYCQIELNLHDTSALWFPQAGWKGGEWEKNTIILKHILEYYKWPTKSLPSAADYAYVSIIYYKIDEPDDGNTILFHRDLCRNSLTL